MQLFRARAPVLILVAAFDDASRVSGMANDRAAVEDTAQIADYFAWSHVLGKIVGLVPGIVVAFVVEHHDALNSMAVVVLGQCPVLAEGLVHGVHDMVLIVAVDVDVGDACEGG